LSGMTETLESKRLILLKPTNAPKKKKTSCIKSDLLSHLIFTTRLPLTSISIPPHSLHKHPQHLRLISNKRFPIVINNPQSILNKPTNSIISPIERIKKCLTSLTITRPNKIPLQPKKPIKTTTNFTKQSIVTKITRKKIMPHQHATKSSATHQSQKKERSNNFRDIYSTIIPR